MANLSEKAAENLAQITSANAPQISGAVLKAAFEGGDLGAFADLSGGIGGATTTKTTGVYRKVGEVQISHTKPMLTDSQIGTFQAPITPTESLCDVSGSTVVTGDIANPETLNTSDVITIEFVDRGDEIQLRIELHDLVRVIAMSGDDFAQQQRERTPLGYSVGRWEGDTLVVTTTSVSWPWFNQSGIPQSAQSVITERFAPEPDRNRLNYELTVADPETFSEPVTLKKHWHWRPGEEILPFNCTQ